MTATSDPCTREAGPSRATPEHIPALDGLRGLAILLVLVYHLRLMTATQPVDGWLIRAADFGWCGVDLFFVLSGFLITGILLDTRGCRNYLSAFFARRALRILPLYYAVVFVSLVVLPAFPHPKTANFGRIQGDELWYWLHLSNFSIARAETFRHGILDVCWSLAIEEQFYLAWPFVVMACSRRSLIAVCCLLFMVALAARAWLLSQGASPISVYVLPFCRMDALAAGGLAAALARERAGGLEGLRPAAWRVAGITGFSLLAFWATGDHEKWDAVATQTVGYSLLAVFFAAVVLLAASGPPAGLPGRWLCSPWLRIAGTYSYGVYLFHLPIRALVRDLGLRPARLPTLWGSQLPGQLIFYLVAGAVAFAAAWLSWHCYEVHWLRLKKYFPYRSRVPPVQP